MELSKYITQHIHWLPEIHDKLVLVTKQQVYQKNKIILPTNNNSKKLFFIEHGLARVFYLKDGKDITLYFLPENRFGIPVDSIFYNRQCRYGIEALEECTIASVDYKNWEELLDLSRELEKFCRVLMIAFNKQATDKLFSLQFMSATERYDSMLENYPDILYRAPLGDIASYLGITQETLSRIRAGILK